MPKSFLFTHKRYDYEDAGTEVKVEVLREEEEDEEDDNPLQDLSRPRDSSGSVSASSSSGGYSEDECFFHFPSARQNPLVKFGKISGREVTMKVNGGKFSIPKEHTHYPAAPKKRRLPTNLTWKELNNNNDDEYNKTPPQIHIKEESPPPMVSSSLNSSFKSLIVSASSSPLELCVRGGTTIVEKQPGGLSSFPHHRGNVIQYYQHQQQPHAYHRNLSPSPPHDQAIFASQPQDLSYQIKLISPPPGGTLPHVSRRDHIKMDSVSSSSSPLQFIIAAAEQQQQAEDQERVFIEGSRSEQSEHQQYQRHHHHHHSQLHQQPELESEPSNNQPIHHQPHHNEEQPVNLSVKKVDLFNLTQLAEVSIAAAKREMNLRSSKVRDGTGSQSFSASSSPSPNNNGNSFKLIIPSKHLGLKKSNDKILAKCKVSKGKGNPVKKEKVCGTSAGENKANNAVRSGETNHKKSNKTEKEAGSNSKDKMVMGKEEMKISATSVAPLSSSSSSSVADSTCATTTGNSSSSSARHRCVECGKGFSTLSNLARHRQTHRSLSDASAVKKCPHCDKVYVSMPAFSMHLRTHNQGCKCPYCGKGFSRPWLLQGHIRTHTGEKPFKCGICSKAFADKSNLRAHTQTHSTEKPFVCARCGKPFALKSYLCKHIESSCMKSNRPSGPSTPTPTSTTSSGGVLTNKKHAAINNSSSASSPVSCSTGGTSPMSTSSSSSPTNNRDIRSSRCSSSSNSINVTTTVIPSTTSSPKTSGSRSTSDASRKKKTVSTKTGLSSHNNNNEGSNGTQENNEKCILSSPNFPLPSNVKANSFPNKSGSHHKDSLATSSTTPKFGRTELLNSSA